MGGEGFFSNTVRKRFAPSELFFSTFEDLASPPMPPSPPLTLSSSRQYDKEKGYYADGEDAWDMRCYFKENMDDAEVRSVERRVCV